MPRRVALFDWDGTLHEGQTMLPWAKFLNSRGLLADDATADLLRAFSDYYASPMADADYLTMIDLVTAAYSRGLKGTKVADVVAAVPDFIESESSELMWFTKELFEGLRAKGVHTVVISGAPIEVLRVLAAPLGVDEIVGLEAVNDGTTYSGKLWRNTAAPGVKGEIVDSFHADDVVLAAGDSAGDAPLLAAARLRLFVGEATPPALTNVWRIPSTRKKSGESILRTVLSQISGVSRVVRTLAS